ncbi:MAG: LamG-like jellyroll fold domain-containing protein, partial [Candidatus Thorarchaeota archaeon]
RTDVRPDGRDIAFAIGEETLSHEIEIFDQTFNSTHAHLIAWVKVPFLSSSSDTVISMYYDNPVAPIVYSSGAVWDSDYVGVWHLGEVGTGLADEYIDSSLYQNHGQGGSGIGSYVPSRVTSPIGHGQNFSDHFIDCGNATSLDITGNQITLQLWMQYPSATHPSMGPFNHKGWYNGYRLIMSSNSQNMRVNLGPKPTGGTYDLSTSQAIAPNQWHHVVATYDGSRVKLYVDGIQDSATMEMTTNILSALPEPFRIGHGDHPEGVPWTYPWLGQIDEVRVSNIARSGAWIQTEFQNQNDPSGFYSVGVEESIGYLETAAINLDSSAPAGVWQASARYMDGSTDVDHRVGIFSRNFIVKRGASLSLTAPGDAVSDGISAKLIGEGLFVEYKLSDLLSSAPIPGATVTMNWTVSGAPTQVQLNDYGDGRYGKILNTTDLGTAQRWRMELTSSHQFYGDANSAFFLDLSGRTYLTYELPTATAYGNDFTLKLTLRDSFDDGLLSNAGFSSNGTLVGLPIDYGNGTYLLTIDSSTLSVGERTFRFTATPADSLLLSSYIDVQFEYRPVSTEAYPVSSDSIEIPWGEQSTVTIHWYDLDHSGIGIDGGTASIVPSVAIQTVDIGGGNYVLTIDTSSYLPGTYAFDVTLSKANYEDATASVTVIVRIHSTTVSTDYSPTSPVGTSTYFDITFLDIDGGSIGVGAGNLSQVTLDWGSGPQAFFSYGFWLDTSSWSVGVYTINVTVYAATGPRYYSDATISVEFEIKRLEVYVS